MQQTTKNLPPQQPAQPTRKPNEAAQFHVDGVVKIFDPNTKEVFVEKRG